MVRMNLDAPKDQCRASKARSMLRTSLTNWDEMRLVDTCQTLTQTEEAFQDANSELEHYPARVGILPSGQADLLVTAVAYQAVQFLLVRLRVKLRVRSLSALRQKFDLMSGFAHSGLDEDARPITLRIWGKPHDHHIELMDLLGIDYDPHKVWLKNLR